MRLFSALRNLHTKIVNFMASSWFVENILIAKVTEDNREYDCIYCTIIRTAILFFSLGFIFRVLIGGLLWA